MGTLEVSISCKAMQRNGITQHKTSKQTIVMMEYQYELLLDIMEL